MYKVMIALMVSAFFHLWAQTYQTAFDSPKIDRTKSQSLFTSNGISVDPGTGNLNVNFPVGPGLGVRGISITPALRGYKSNKLLDGFKWEKNGFTATHVDCTFDRYESRKPFEFKWGGNFWLWGPADDYKEEVGRRKSHFTLPSGKTGSVGSDIRNGITVDQALKLVAGFGISVSDYTANLGVPVLAEGSGSELVVYLGAKDAVRVNPGSCLMGKFVAPKRVAMIAGEVAYEFAFDQYHYASCFIEPGTCGPVGYSGSSLTWSAYRLIAIYNRYGDSLQISQNKIELYQNGVSTGKKVEINPIPITDGGNGSTVRVDYDFAGIRQSFEVQDGALFSIRSVETGLKVSGNGNRITLPGKCITLEWLDIRSRPNATEEVWAGYAQRFDPRAASLVTQLTTKAVSKMTSCDLATGENRITEFARVVPVPTQSRNGWQSVDFSTATIMPDGKVILRIMASPLNNGKDNGPSDGTLDEQMQTLAHLKHVVCEERTYDVGVDWRADVNRDAASSIATRIQIFDRFDARDVKSPDGVFSEIAIPYPTRTRQWVRETGVMTYNELTGWDKISCSWSLEKWAVTKGGPDFRKEWRSLQAKGEQYVIPAGALFSRETRRNSEADVSNWVFKRLQYEVQSFGADLTGGSVAASGGILPSKTFVYDSLGFTRLKSVTIKDINTYLCTTYDYRSNTGIGASQLDNVNVSGSTNLLVPTGGVGVQKFSYDPVDGYLNAIQLRGVGWTHSQSVDSAGRVVLQTDPNGLKTVFEWDAAGRLARIAPDGMVATTVEYDADGMGFHVRRGVSHQQYRYNGFGEMVLERRWAANGTVSHRTYGQYANGAKRFVSVWIDGPGQESESILTDPGFAADRYWYDGQGREVLSVTAAGIRTETKYLGLEVRVIAGAGTSSAQETSKTYDALGRLITTQDALGGIVRFRYDLSGKMSYAGAISLAGAIQERYWDYNGLGWLTRSREPEVGEVKYDEFYVNGKHGLKIELGASGLESGARRSRYKYDSLGRVLTIADNNGQVVKEFCYDMKVLSGVDHGLSASKMVYARDGGVIQNFVYSARSGGLSQMLSEIWTGGKVGQGERLTVPIQFTVDEYGNRNSMSYGQGCIEYEFDHAVSKERIVKRNGVALSVDVFDPLSWNRSARHFANGSSTVYGYGIDQSQLVGMDLFAGSAWNGSWAYTYDGMGRMISDGEDVYAYDKMGHLVSAAIKRLDATTGIVNPANVVEMQLGYDSFGNMIKKVSTVGVLPMGVAQFAMNESEKVAVGVRNQIPGTVGGVSTGIVYGQFGEIVQFSAVPTNGSSKLISLKYDSQGRVAIMADNARSGYTEEYCYDAAGQRTLIIEKKDGTTVKGRVNIYDDQARLVTRMLWVPSSNPLIARNVRSAKNITPDQGAANPMAVILPPEDWIAITSPSDGATFACGQVISFKGSASGPLGLAWNFGDGTTATGKSILKTYSKPGSYTVSLSALIAGGYTLHESVRIIIVDAGSMPPVINTFVSDKVSCRFGDAITLSWSISGASSVQLNGKPVVGTSLTVYPGVTSSYTLFAKNASGVTSKSLMISLPPCVRILRSAPEVAKVGEAVTITWSVGSANTVKLDDVLVATVGSKSLTLPASRRIRLTASNDSGTTEAELYIGDASASNNLKWQTDIVYLNGSVVAECGASGPLFMQSDHLGTPRVISDANGKVVGRQKYLPFGELLDSWGSTSCSKGYTGHEQMEPSGLIYMNARMYIPSYGKFTSPDPGRDYGVVDLHGFNLFGYCSNRPVDLNDPTGMFSFLADVDTNTQAEMEQSEKMSQLGIKSTTSILYYEQDTGYAHINTWTEYKDGSWDLKTTDLGEKKNYSGRGEGKNNPSMEDEKGNPKIPNPNAGVIPDGSYKVSGPEKKPGMADPVLRLTPDGGQNMHGRNGFLIHGDSNSHPGEASQGCIVMPKWARQAIVDLNVSSLVVQPSAKYQIEHGMY